MRSELKGVTFLCGNRGSFTNKEGEVINYQKVTIFDKSGGEKPLELTLDSTIPFEHIKAMDTVDCVLNITQTSSGVKVKIADINKVVK